MDGTAVKEIKAIIENSQIVEVDGCKFAPRGYEVIRNVDHGEAIKLTTLRSLAEFVKENPQGLDLEGAIVVIDEEFAVCLESAPSHKDSLRTRYVAVKNPIKPFQFGKHYPSEAFAIALQSQFVYDANAIELWKNASQIQIEEGVTFLDDGISQKIRVQKGISAASVEDKLVKSVTMLRPYRIFLECEQPESPFLFRLKGNKEDGAFVALYETDGGSWQVEAFGIIAAKLKEYGLELPIYY